MCDTHCYLACFQADISEELVILFPCIQCFPSSTGVSLTHLQLIFDSLSPYKSSPLLLLSFS